jgi:exo-1,4-beta-D-glucosaminidase
MFEAFRVRLPKTTGIIQWMLNSAWPSTYWQLYDYYLLPTSAYYAARKANEPLQLIYDYHNNAVFAINETSNNLAGLKAEIRIFGLNSQLLLQKEIRFAAGVNKPEKVFSMNPLTETVFLDLRLYDSSGKQLAQNFYWLSEKPDVFAWDKTTWAYTPMKEFADFSGLSALPSCEISASGILTEKGDKAELTATLENHSNTIAFFINLSLQDETGQQLYPVFWTDNYISLLPGEKREIRCSMAKNTVKTGAFLLQLNGWNSKKQTLKIKVT